MYKKILDIIEYHSPFLFFAKYILKICIFVKHTCIKIILSILFSIYAAEIHNQRIIVVNRENMVKLGIRNLTSPRLGNFEGQSNLSLLSTYTYR